MKGSKPFGYLDRLSQNIRILDEAVGNAQRIARPKKKGVVPNVQALKILRDLIELRNATLLETKAHLLGRDQTGAIREPADYYKADAQVMYERDFQRFLEPWQKSDLKLECEDCGVENEEVESRPLTTTVPSKYPNILPDEQETEYHNLCAKCYEKRITTNQKENTS